ncbi:MAG TPA: uroporphyrinogen-III synthase [Paracoccaceae bacterium]|nr:uroporphyrinogen-III synthase [Paracoccaceae bacterium]
MAILVLTRPEEASRRFLAAVEKGLGRPVEHVLSPAIEIEDVPHRRIPEDCRAIILTSEQGARRAKEAGARAGMVAWCVGDRTAEAARAEGFDAISAGGDVEALVAAIIQAKPDAPLVHVRGEHTTGNVAARLTQAGFPTRDHVVYRQKECEVSPEVLKALARGETLVVPLFSPRSAEAFVRQIAGAGALRVVAMSSAVADKAASCGAQDILVADRPNLDAMVLATCRRLSMA